MNQCWASILIETSFVGKKYLKRKDGVLEIKMAFSFAFWKYKYAFSFFYSFYYALSRISIWWRRNVCAYTSALACLSSSLESVYAFSFLWHITIWKWLLLQLSTFLLLSVIQRVTIIFQSVYILWSACLLVYTFVDICHVLGRPLMHSSLCLEKAI